MKILENGYDFNPVRVTGVVADSPRTGTTQQGKPWTRFLVIDDDDGATVNVVCYNDVAKTTVSTLRKETRVDVTGYRPSKPRSFQRRDGTLGYSQDVNAREVKVQSVGIVAD